jgi:thiamine-phosphate pyrophosphorylase
LIRTDSPDLLLGVCRHRRVAGFLPNLEQALAFGADGALLDGREDMEDARQRVGESYLLGALCGTSRHAAMVAGEAGADFVGFGGEDHPLSKRLVDLVAWWSELFVLPCLALGRFDPHAAGVLTRAGADLIAVDLGGGDVATRLDAFREALAPEAPQTAKPEGDRR